MILMPDVQIICTSSTERDLRFYDVVAKKFELRMMVCIELTVVQNFFTLYIIAHEAVQAFVD